MSENTHAGKSQVLLEQMGRIPVIVQGKVSLHLVERDCVAWMEKMFFSDSNVLHVLQT